MADITLAPAWPRAIPIARPALFARLVYRTEVLRRRARRNRYLALTGRSARTYPWFLIMFRSMSGR
jgi:hypothetical protein